MEKVLRKSGVRIIGDIPWGTHISLFYHNPGDLINVLVPYFRSGLASNELCQWIVSGTLTVGDAAAALRRSVPDMDRYLESGQMSIAPHSEWYLKGKIFDPGEVARRWRDLLEKARAGGYDGLRVTGDTAWLQPEDWADFMGYERELGEISGHLLAICTYSLERCRPGEVIDVVSRHQFSLVKRDGKWDCIERQKYNLMEHTLKKRVKELRCLYDIASISGEAYLTLGERFTEIVELLPRAMQHPEIAFARITLNGENFNTGNYRKTDYRASADIIVNGAKAGEVEVGYIKAPPLTENGQFSKEEGLLLDAVAERLGAIAEHRQAEEALRESEEKFSKAFRSTPAIVAISTLENGQFLELNDGFLRFSGYTREEVIGHTVSDLNLWLSPEERQRTLDILKKREKVRNKEFEFRIKSGEIRTVLSSIERINFAGKECLIFVSTDITESKRAEEEVRESENKYRSLFEGMLNGFAYCKILVDENNNPVDFTYLEVNDAFERLTGLKREDVVGKKVTEAIPGIKESHGELFDIYGKVALTGEPTAFELYFQPLAIWLTISVYSPAKGYFVALFDNITERKQAEQQVKDERDKTQRYLDIAGVIFVAIDTAGNVTLINPKGCQVLGYREDEIIGRSWFDNFLPERLRKQVKAVSRKLLAGEAEAAEYYVNPVLTRSGEERLIAWHNRLLRDEDGNVTGHLSSGEDITEQKQSEELLQSISSSSPVGLYIVQDDRLQYTNPQFQKITGYSQVELLGREMLSLVALEDSDVVRSSTMFTLQEDNPYPCEYRILNKTGQIKWVMQTVSPIHYQGREAILGNIMDITERKYLERKVIEYEELSKMKSDLLATVSHELRTPLATIKGYSTMILDYYARIGAEETREYLKSIDGSTDRLAKLVDNLLDTSRLEAGLLKLQRAPTHIDALIGKAAEEAGVRATQHHITVELDKGLPRVNIDAKRIRQVLDNLIDNAVKYSPPQTEVLISARRSGRELLVSVTDQGPGIPAEELTNVFDRMYRIEQRLSSGADGMGLGLYICQRLVETHGGRIWAESTVGQGSTIWFTLPVMENAGKAKRPTVRMR
ncbi:MAG: hypothetical protein A2Z05_04965 [Chloroflexi bacterium RBG_16_60_22]|nr:MAG: hypothetical protein A2Z05_04965 [Chloroflexi bacterium RBG_16_60_22]